MRWLVLILLAGLTLGLPNPQDEGDVGEDADEEDAIEDDVDEEVADEEEADEEYEEDASENDSGYSFSTGLSDPEPDREVDEDSDVYFNSVENEDDDVVGAGERSDSYSAVDAGLVTKVKDQGECESCAAFSTAAVVEVCAKKITGMTFDLSEQQLIECAERTCNSAEKKYFEEQKKTTGIPSPCGGVKGCNPATMYFYLDWINATKPLALVAETDYPYLGNETKSPPKCKAKLPAADLGVVVSNFYLTINGTEELLRRLVLKHGAVLATIYSQTLHNYTGGVFEGCDPCDFAAAKAANKKCVDHAVTVVGYGKSKGKDFWLIKNSWGTSKGEKGYIRLLRGVGKCGIGKQFAVVECEEVYKCTDDDDYCDNAEADSSSSEEE